MAAADTLQEGSSFSLLTEPENNEDRQVYFVKLTDSCLQAIQEFIQGQKTGSRTKSIIRFNEAQNGIVTIPGRHSSSQDSEKKFHFGISNQVHSENNPLPECIKQSWNSNQLLSFGPLEQKISIAATDDSFVNTGKRMALVEQERKDVRTKEVKLAGKGKLNNIHKKNIVPDTKSSQPTKTVNKKITPSVPLNKNTTHSPKPAVTSSTNHHSSANLSKRSPVPANNPRKTSPTSSTNSTANPSPAALNGRTFTCKERVIHILGLRSHKESELISRLQREAMSQKDRNNLKMVLRQVTSYSDNQYTLNPKYYSDIQVNTWPFYTESEKATVKKNIAANIIKKTDATSPPVVSSTSKSPEEKSLKRTPAPDICDSNNSTSKKQKLEVSEEPSSTSVSPPKNTAPRKEERTHKEERKKTNHISAAPISNGSAKPQESNEATAAVVGDESPPTVASTSDSPEYLSTYKPITTREQRLQYKRDFQLEYPEYIELKTNLDAITRKFMELDQSLKKCEEGSAEYLEIQEEIKHAYNKQLEDEKYHTMKSRCEELHHKLGHIKRLVCEYDQQMVNS